MPDLSTFLAIKIMSCSGWGEGEGEGEDQSSCLHAESPVNCNYV